MIFPKMMALHVPFTPSTSKGGGNSQYAIYGRTNCNMSGRIAALLFACVARHTALRAPCTRFPGPFGPSI